MSAALTTTELDQSVVADAMHEGILFCTPDTPLSEVAEVMAAKRVHCVVVAEDGERCASLWGVVSDLDLVAAAAVRDLGEQLAEGSAASPALMIAPSETLLRAAQLMTEHATAHLIVVEPETQRPVGVLSTLDIAQSLVGPATI
jgi:predicted transcriptional regulator